MLSDDKPQVLATKSTGHIKGCVLDKLAIYGLLNLFTDITACRWNPELPYVTLIMGVVYFVCWVIYQLTNQGKLPQIFKSVCFTTFSSIFTGLSNICLTMDNNDKSPSVTDNDQDHFDSFIKQHECVKNYVLDVLAIYVPKAITIILTYGVQLMLILLGSIYVTNCRSAPELPIVTIIMGTLYAVCWTVYHNTEPGKLAQKFKIACYTIAICVFIVLLAALSRAIYYNPQYYPYCSGALITPVSTFVIVVLTVVIKLKVIDPVAKVLKSRKTY
ncbi:unnamed protein product, partial [Medioppia subpectinata]